MILVERGPECPRLAEARRQALKRLRATTVPSKADVAGYEVAAEQLWKVQHRKCCYCEHRITKSYNDVEHYRPKLRADRQPGSVATHGYHWLAFEWENLLFACPLCNRSAKNDQFPLATKSSVLRRNRRPPGGERPLLLDAGGRINPVLHITFEYRLAKHDEKTMSVGSLQWFARPRGTSSRGSWTIEVCDMNNQELLEIRGLHVDQHVMPKVQELNEALAANDLPRVQRAFFQAHGLLARSSEFVAVSYAALRHHVSDASLAKFCFAWPEPRAVAERTKVRRKLPGPP